MNEVVLQRERRGGELVPVWKGKKGWHRDLTPGGQGRSSRPDDDMAVRYEAVNERVLPLEEPKYFQSSVPKADQMTLGELRSYIAQLRASGSNVVPYLGTTRKIAFPLVTVVMSSSRCRLPSPPRRGALRHRHRHRVAIVYFIVMSVFVAMGQGGILTPVLAAWAPNLMFGALAAYMILTVRT
jgi:lipopolysaccharide export LptBFGC system permease protein LptF